MLENIAKSGVRNPLTVIAMFAGLAEISGTVVLPLLTKNVQETFIWFLMTFPGLLVLLFFVTLWKKPNSLYSPSDYQNDSSFLESIRFGTALEMKYKNEIELKEIKEGIGTEMRNASGNDDMISVRISEAEDGSTPTRQPYNDIEQAFERIEDTVISMYREKLHSSPFLGVGFADDPTGYRYDAVFFGEVTTVLEIKVVVAEHAIDNAVREIVDQMNITARSMQRSKLKSTCFIAVVVCLGSIANKNFKSDVYTYKYFSKVSRVAVRIYEEADLEDILASE